MSDGTLRIATRASNLALWQARHVAALLRERSPGLTVELVHVTTSGDSNQTDALSQFGGVGVFTREVQRAVLDGRADLAVHSLKDLPTEPVAGLVLAAVPERASVDDVLVLPALDQLDAAAAVSAEGSANHSPPSASQLLASLPPRARVGTGSLRRRAQLLHLRSDLELLEVRGNVETRLRKLDEGQYHALVLAEAGLRRLGLGGRISGLLRAPDMLPAVGQGALGIECREGDASTLTLLAGITDAATHTAVRAERSLLAELRAGCHAPLGVSTSTDGVQLRLEAVVLSADGTKRLHVAVAGRKEHPEELGRKAAAEFLKFGAAELLAAK